MGNSTKAVVCGGTKARTADDCKEGSLGEPEKIVNLGANQIYVHKDLKVRFQNGKVVGE